MREKGQEYPVAVMTKLLSDSLLFVKHKLEPSQMASFANMFVNNNPTLTIDEVVFLLTKGINGGYGKTYGDFDFSVLSDWRGQYEELDRSIYLESKNQTKGEAGSSQRTSAHGNSFGAIVKDSISKINEAKNPVKETDALNEYKQRLKK